MIRPHVVLDTNVLVSGLRSRRGASFRLLDLVGDGAFDLHLSVPLVLEYEEVLMREVAGRFVPASAVEAILDFHCAVAHHHRVYFLWRPTLRDPSDDMVLELAVTAGADVVVTHNLRDFAGVDRFGLRAVPPGAFLAEIGDSL
ncbi:putative toxin-antitoxin system toxin component, PIN family [Rubrivirga sp. S365]|uniref:putative toxin-antitoxin system toxin component, PIN family n=1 Tax=Rubrivirga sp. S365 TaxID=3076080 RepID=UPI0028C9C645|nr:putative toxin-antitoxin system toxin component, PIN family [Rubrivirga sp. S365]MDT7857027.1 putative toxin-antitoxin system toxin component, PIN family [Rubrivirga sp. S365]